MADEAGSSLQVTKISFFVCLFFNKKEKLNRKEISKESFYNMKTNKCI